MKHTIKDINRTVYLDSNLVQKYTKYNEIDDGTFLVYMYTKFGKAPTIEDISDDDLSEMCNLLLFHELKALSVIPQISNYISEHKDEIKNNANLGIMKELQL